MSHTFLSAAGPKGIESNAIPVRGPLRSCRPRRQNHPLRTQEDLIADSTRYLIDVSLGGRSFSSDIQDQAQSALAAEESSWGWSLPGYLSDKFLQRLSRSTS